jgi:hypothetical protein
LKTLFPKSKALQLFQAKLLSGAVNGRVFEQDTANPGMKDCRLHRSTTTKIMMVLSVFEFPRVATLVVQQAWVVVSLVQVFEDGGKDFGLSISHESESTRECCGYGSYSSGSSTLFDALSKNWSRRAAVKKGDKDRTSS